MFALSPPALGAGGRSAWWRWQLAAPLCPVGVTLSCCLCQGFTYSHSWDVGRVGGGGSPTGCCAPSASVSPQLNLILHSPLL